MTNETASLSKSARTERSQLHLFVRFLALGGIAAFVNWSTRFAYQWIMPFELALIAAYATGMIVAFLLYSIFVFPGSSENYRSQIMWFLAVNAASATVMWLSTIALAKYALPAIGWTWHVEAVAHALGIPTPAIVSFLGHRSLTWKR